MKLSPVTQMKLAAVLTAMLALLGCEAPTSSAGEQTPPVYSAAIAPAPRPDLVTVSEPTPGQPAPAGLPFSGPVAAGLPQAPEALSAEEPARAPVQLSSRLQEVVKLAQSGVGDDVILAFVQNSPVAFSPNPDEIVYLTDLGLSDVVITSLVNHGTTPAVAMNQTPPAPTNAGPAPMPTEAPNWQANGVPGATYNPEPQVVYSSPPVVQYVTPPPTVENNYFYSSLSPYGSWVEVADQGWCWQPTVAVVHQDWRPYGDRGRWLSTDCGWYWQSDYSWGWAPFHYGRWFNHPGRGWCWRPDSVWAPAWVSWRYTDSYCGWAPLPPGAHFHEHSGFTYYGAHVGVSFGFGLHRDAWTFVPAGHVHDREVWQHRIPPSEHQVVYRQSKVINNYVVNNNTIINNGVPRDRVPAMPRTEVRKVAVRDMPERGGTAVRPDRLHQEGSEVVVYRPKPLGIAPTENLRGGGNSARTITSQQPAVAGRPGINSVNNVTAAPPAGGTSSARGEGRPRAEIPGGNGSGARLSQGAAPAAGSGLQHSLDQRPTQATVPTASVTPGQSVAPQSYRSPGAPSSTPRVEPSRTPYTQTPAVQAPAPRQEQPRSAVTGADRSAPAVPTYRTPAAASNPSLNQAPTWPQSTVPSVQRPAISAPQAVAQPTPTYRQEPSRPTYSAPARSIQPQMADSVPSLRPPTPTPSSSFSLPAQGGYVPPQTVRPAPSYTPPPMQARPSPSYSAPVQSRPAQAAPTYSAPAVRPAPAQAQPDRSGNRRQF